LKGRTRIAPTPSGFLHLENLYSFVNTWLLSQEGNLEIVLRIDDMDQGRLRMEYLDDIFRSLESLGVDYQIGPSGPSDFIENWSQRKRLNHYQLLISRLKQDEFSYPCNCNRKERARTTRLAQCNNLPH